MDYIHNTSPLYFHDNWTIDWSTSSKRIYQPHRIKKYILPLTLMIPIWGKTIWPPSRSRWYPIYKNIILALDLSLNLDHIYIPGWWKYHFAPSQNLHGWGASVKSPTAQIHDSTKRLFSLIRLVVQLLETSSGIKPMIRKHHCCLLFVNCS